jgi:hypothetical protein
MWEYHIIRRHTIEDAGGMTETINNMAEDGWECDSCLSILPDGCGGAMFFQRMKINKNDN